MPSIKRTQLIGFSGLFVGLCFGLAAAGCGDDAVLDGSNSGPGCTPNATLSCVCGDSVTTGLSTCDQAGAYGACLPCAGGGSGSTGGSGFNGGAGIGTGTSGVGGTSGTSGTGTSGVGGTSGTGTSGVGGTSGAGTGGTAGVPASTTCENGTTCAENALLASQMAGFKFCGMSGAVGHVPPTCTSAADCTAYAGSMCTSIPVLGMGCLKTCQ